MKLEDLPQDIQDLITYTWRIDSEDGNPPEPIEELVKRYTPEVRANAFSILRRITED